MEDKVVKSLVFDVVLQAALQAMSAAVPFLRLPIINTLFNFIVTKVANALYEELVKYVTFTLIDLRVGAQRAAYERAVEELRVVHDAPQPNSEDVERAKEKFKSTLRDLI